MIRYVLVDGVRHVLHAFVAEKALVEEIKTGKVLLVPAEDCTFDPPTEQFIREAQMAELRSRAAGNAARIVHG